MAFLRAFGLIGGERGVGLRRRVARIIARGTLVIMGVKLRRRGRAPEAPFFLVANHLSWLDSIVFMAESAAVFVAMDEIRRMPFLGILVDSFGVVFIRRRSLRDIGAVSRKILSAMDRGDGVMVFPEGDTSVGHELLPFSSALLQQAVEQKQPVHAAALAFFSSPGWPDASVMVAWADWTPIFVHIARMLLMPRVSACISYPTPALRGTSRGELARDLRQQIANELKIIQPKFADN